MTRGSKEHDALGKWHERQGGGLTVTFGRGLEREVRVYGGTWREASRKRLVRKARPIRTHAVGDFVTLAVAECRALGPDWRILCISTPRTILTDLVGRDNDLGPSYEAMMVPRADHDVLAPHLLGESVRAQRDRRVVGL